MNTVTLSPPKNLRDWFQIYRLYLSAFPPSERKPFFIIFRRFFRGSTDLWCIREEGSFRGFAATVNSPGIILLDYLAIRPRFRKSGIGSAALGVLKGLYPGKGLFVEIESTLSPGEDLPLRLRRKRFYTGAGMVPMGVTANVFGVQMELLGWDCALDFQGYRSFYRDHYSPWAAEHILPE